MKTAIKTVLSLAFLAIVSSLLYNFILSIYYGEAVINEFPGNDEIKEVNFIFQLKEEQGSEIWPGFDTTDIPVILFNDKYEFLITRGSADDSWSEIACKKV